MRFWAKMLYFVYMCGPRRHGISVEQGDFFRVTPGRIKVLVPENRVMRIPTTAATNTISRQQLGIQLDDLSAGPGGAVVPPHGEAKSVGDIGFLVSQSGSVRTSRLRLLSVFISKIRLSSQSKYRPVKSRFGAQSPKPRRSGKTTKLNQNDER